MYSITVDFRIPQRRLRKKTPDFLLLLLKTFHRPTRRRLQFKLSSEQLLKFKSSLNPASHFPGFGFHMNQSEDAWRFKATLWFTQRSHQNSVVVSSSRDTSCFLLGLDFKILTTKIPSHHLLGLDLNQRKVHLYADDTSASSLLQSQSDLRNKNHHLLEEKSSSVVS